MYASLCIDAEQYKKKSTKFYLYFEIVYNDQFLKYYEMLCVTKAISILHHNVTNSRNFIYVYQHNFVMLHFTNGGRIEQFSIFKSILFLHYRKISVQFRS